MIITLAALAFYCAALAVVVALAVDDWLKGR